MSTLLVLGSKPDPSLPPGDSFDDVACANASGYSAARHSLPVPAITAMSVILTSGIGSGRQSLMALHGLQTDTLYLVPRFDKPEKLVKRLKKLPVTLRCTPAFFRFRLRLEKYHWNRFLAPDAAYFQDMIGTLCRHDSQIMDRVLEKKPSTGVITLMIGMSQGQYDRFIMSGFDFQLTHAYAENPEIRQRGSTASRHTPTDLQVLRRLADIHGNIFTTEAAVNEQAGIPLL
jgi:hypothetical protein